MNHIFPNSFDTLKEFSNLCLLNKDLSKKITEQTKYISFWTPYLKKRRDILFGILDNNLPKDIALAIKNQYVLIPYNISEYLDAKILVRIRSTINVFLNDVTTGKGDFTKAKDEHDTIYVYGTILKTQDIENETRYRLDEYSKKLVQSDSFIYGIGLLVRTGPFTSYVYSPSLGPFAMIGEQEEEIYGKWIGNCTFEGYNIGKFLYGFGTMTFKNGTYIKGEWADNRCIEGVYYDSNRDIISENILTTEFCDNYKRITHTMRIYNTSSTLDLYYFARTGEIYNYDEGPRGPTGPPPS